MARLPTLCDIEYQTDEQNEGQSEVHFIFDDGLGNLRQSRLYSLDELVDMAKTWEGTNADISSISNVSTQEEPEVSLQETKEGDLQ